MLLCSALLLNAQQREVYIVVKDSLTQQPLVRVNILDKTHNQYGWTNKKGSFRLSFEPQSTAFILEVSHDGYFTRQVTVDANTTEITVLLKQNTYEIKEVEIFPVLPVHLYFGKKNAQVLDYVATPLFVMVCWYDIIEKNCFITLLDSGNRITDERQVPADFEKFYISGLNYIYAICSEQILAVSVKKSMLLYQPVADTLFNRKIQFYKGGHDRWLYLSLFSHSHQTVVYFLEDLEKKIIYQYQPFCMVSDRRKEKNARREKIIGEAIREQEMQEVLDVPPSIRGSRFSPEYNGILDEHEGDVSFFHKETFNQHYVEKPLYAPLFMMDSNFCIFDFVKGEVHFFSYDTQLDHVLPIAFQKTEGWKGQVLKDEKQHFYAPYAERGGTISLHALNPVTFSAIREQTLSYPEAENIHMSGDYVYYLRQPSEKRQEVFLFREMIR